MSTPQPKHTGHFLRIPYDWRRPTWARIRARTWNAAEQRLLLPKVFGWGWDLNLHEVSCRLSLIRRPPSA